MKNLKFKLVAAILAFIIGVVGVWVSGFLSSPAVSNTQHNLSIQVDLSLTDKPLVEQTFDNLETNSDQLPNDETDLGVFNPSGNYLPLNSPSDESERFIQFDLEVRRKKGKLVAWGEVRGVQRWYKFTSISVTEKHLKFSTAKTGGVNYDFDGEFLGKGDFSSPAQTGNILLKGTLRKFVNGKKVVEVNTSFKHYPGC